MKVNVISESALFALKEKFGGIHSAFVNHVSLLKKKGIDVVINSSEKADIIHFHSYAPFALTKLLTATSPTVVYSHNVPETFIGSVKGAGIFLGGIQAYFRFFYNKADLVLALNPKTKDDLEKLGVTSRIEVLSNAINSDLFKKDKSLREQGRMQYNLTEKDFVVVGVGKQIPRKGIVDFLLTAQKFPEITFVWAGSKDIDALSPQSDTQKQLMENPPKNVIIAGLVPYEKIAVLYNMADVFLFPSYQEIASMVVIEAAACGLPLILRDLPEYKALYTDGYFAGRSVEDFSKELEKLSSDKLYYQKQVAESKKLADKFGEDAIGDKLVAYYNSLLR